MQKEPLALRISARLRPWIPIAGAVIAFAWIVSASRNGNLAAASAAIAFVVGWALRNAIEMAETPFRKRHFEKLSAWRATGCCMECGYDLRASSDRCPECGATIPPPPLPDPEDIIRHTTPSIRIAVARAAQIARDRGDGHVGTEHVLLAIVEDDESAGGAVLWHLDVTPERATAALDELMGRDATGQDAVRRD